MIDKLNSIFKKIEQKKFYFYAPILCFLTDIALIFYISNNILPRLVNTRMIKAVLLARGTSINQLSPDSISFLIQMISTSMRGALGIILIINFIIFMLALKKFKFGLKYISGYCLSAAILSIIEITGYIISGEGFSLITFVTMISYFLIYWGYRYFSKMKEE